MKIGIIGAGQIGGTLVEKYSQKGHKVKITNQSGPEKLKDLASETGASPVTIIEVVMDVDVIVIALPMNAIPHLPKGLFDNVPATTAIIDTCNYYPIRDGKIEAIENDMTESVWVSEQLQRSVIKAYNTILFRSLVNSGLPKGNPSRLALPLAGDDTKQKNLVSMLIDDCGFDSFDYGMLKDSWKQQPGSPVYCTDLTLSQMKKSIVRAKKEQLPGKREEGLSYILSHDPELWKENVNYNRKLYESELE